MRDPVLKCERCKLSECRICTDCGRHVCQHQRCGGYHPVPVPRYVVGARYSTRAESTRGRYTTQSSPWHYHRKDAEEWEAAAWLAGLTVHVRRVDHRVNGVDWRGRPYSTDCGWYEVWIETDTDHEREDRTALREARLDVRTWVLGNALREDRESYNRKETIARYSGLL